MLPPHHPSTHMCCLLACRCTQQGQDQTDPGQVWDGLNAYNFAPLLAKDVPRHGLTHTCSTCRKQFLLALEGGGTSFSRGGGGGLNCSQCCCGVRPR